jgi:hypothetical protein
MATLPDFSFVGQMARSQMQGLGMVYHTIQMQAELLSFNDIYRFLSYAMLFCLPISFLFKKSRVQAGGPMH